MPKFGHGDEPGMVLIRRRCSLSTAQSTWRGREIEVGLNGPTRSRNGSGGLRGLMATCRPSMPIGLATEIHGHLKEGYGRELSPALISTITDAVLEDVRLCHFPLPP
jgi:hypothetical protein